MNKCYECGAEGKEWVSFGVTYQIKCTECDAKTWVYDTKEKALEAWGNERLMTMRMVDDILFDLIGEKFGECKTMQECETFKREIHNILCERIQTAKDKKWFDKSV